MPFAPAPSLLACGLCIDMPLTDWLPFLAYWIWILLIWSLLAGPVCRAVAKRFGSVEGRSPFFLVLVFLATLIVGALLLGGAMIAPFLFVLPFWGMAIARGLRQPNRIWRWANLVLLAVLVACVPISYTRPRPFSDYRLRVENLKRETATFSRKPHPPKAAPVEQPPPPPAEQVAPVTPLPAGD